MLVCHFKINSKVMMCQLAVRRRQTNCVWVNPLSPNIHLQILQTDLHTFPLKIVEIKAFSLW